MSSQPQLSIVIPALNEAAAIGPCLQALQRYRNRCEIIVADGGSDDASVVLAVPLADKIVHAPRGRARQMNAGAVEAQAELLLFLHADTLLPDDALTLMQQGIAKGSHWGRFDVRLDGKHPLLKIVARLMNMRSRITGIATGDQGMFMTRQAFRSVGGFPEIALMEDIAVSKRLKKLGKPYCIAQKIVTSARRWEQHGVLQTVLLMWRLRWHYFFGADPEVLAQRYDRSH
ncbi:MAG: TIGR04283 family arsenosugar biosynthesis glycosyltransferase [Gammaproteobacteria bacterium]